MVFVLSNVIVGIVLLCVAVGIYKSASGKGTRKIAVLCTLLGLVGLYVILVLGLGLISIG